MALAETLAAQKVRIVVVGVLVVVAGSAATVAVLGWPLPFMTSDGMVDTVPDEADFVVTVDTDVAEDETTMELVDEAMALENGTSDSNGTDEGDDPVAEFENETGLAFEDLQSVTVYGRYPGGVDTVDAEYLGILIDSDWEESAFREAIENGSEYDTREYEGYTIYVEPESETESEFGDDEDPSRIGVLGDGRYVLGNETAVTDAIDVDRGAAPALEGDLREAYDSTPDGYIRFAATVPEPEDEELSAAMDDDGEVPDNAKRIQEMLDIGTVSGAYYTTDEQVGLELRMRASSADNADDLQALLDGSITAIEYSVPPNETAALFDDTTVEQRGQDVVLTFESTPERIVDAVQALTDAVDSYVEDQFGAALAGSNAGPGEWNGSDGTWNESDAWENDDEWNVSDDDWENDSEWESDGDWESDDDWEESTDERDTSAGVSSDERRTAGG